MIGVVTNPGNEAVVSEFLELFKTPWEFYKPGREYSVLLCDRHGFDNAELVIVFSSEDLSQADAPNVNNQETRTGGGWLTYRQMQIPIYGRKVTFPDEGHTVLVDAESGESAIVLRRSGGKLLIRVGYDLFPEIRSLLTVGQPSTNALLPALELHISLLRDLIISAGVQLIEIPPLPYGYKFVACLTHDVDHPSIRRHLFDHTLIGFLYRATVGSLLDLFKRRTSLRQLLTNWWAVVKLPFVQLGLAKDFWQAFVHYPQLEGGRRSSFFVIPFKGKPGRRDERQAPALRAAGYGAADIGDSIRTLISVGCEVGLHGIDAWCDKEEGRKELAEIRRIAGIENAGVRTHWLYQNERSFAILESAGADYDSTVGYNEAVGYRAGTTQVYKPLDTARLVELPLHVMDTALFFPGRLHLSIGEASKRVDQIIDNAVRFGGVVTVNWHDRSIAPERLWDGFYLALVDKLQNRGAWFATAGQTVSWFRKRRSAKFESDRHSDVIAVRDTLAADTTAPALILRVHNDGATRSQSELPVQPHHSQDIPLPDVTHICIASARQGDECRPRDPMFWPTV